MRDAGRAVDSRDKIARHELPRLSPYTRPSESVADTAMRFPPDFIDELRARLPVSEVVGRRVKLRKTGREWVGLSPFNQEKSPSFTVNDQKGFFHDFSSGKHGDIFDFVMQTECVTFPEAVKRLAGMAGLPVPKVSKEAQAREERRKTVHDVG